MIYIRDEGQRVRNGINFYPLSSNQVGFVVKFGKFVRFVRYSRDLRKFRYHGANQNGIMVEWKRLAEIALIICYNLALLAGASYLVYYKDASAWIYLLALVFGAKWADDEEETK